MPTWLATNDGLAKVAIATAAKPLCLSVVVNKSFGFQQIDEAIDFYKANMTSGKVFLRASLTQ